MKKFVLSVATALLVVMVSGGVASADSSAAQPESSHSTMAPLSQPTTIGWG